MKEASLRVLPNPYFELDAHGMPAGMCVREPGTGRPGVVEFIGVTVARKAEKFDERDPHRARATPRRPAKLVYAQAPVEIPATPMHVDYVRKGALLAADQPTARACKIWFVPPAHAIEQAKMRAIEQWCANHAEPPPIDQWDDAVDSTPAAAANKVASSARAGSPAQEPYFASPFAPATAALGKVS